MSVKMEHTPTPWVVSTAFISGRKLSDANGRVIVETWPINDEEEIANAAFIVRAVNAHDALLNVAKMAAKTEHRQTELSGRCVRNDCLRCWAEAAIALAKKEA